MFCLTVLNKELPLTAHYDHITDFPAASVGPPKRARPNRLRAPVAITSSLSESPGEDSDELRVLVAVVMVSPPAVPPHSTLSRPGRP